MNILLNKTFIILCFSAWVFTANGQDSLYLKIQQGIEFHDRGDFDGAIDVYNEVIEIDSLYLIAYAEKAFSLFSDKKYEEAIVVCEKVLNLPFTEQNGMEHIFTTYGNCLDILNRPEEALEIYNKGIQLFPTYEMLYFNMGITYSKLRKYDEALLVFNMAILAKPDFSSTHNAVGRILKHRNNNIASLLALSRFLILEPKGYRAQPALLIINDIMTAGVEKKGKRKVNININAELLETHDKVLENDFRSTELILSMAAALDYDKKNKNKNEIERMVLKYESIFSSLKETRKDNFGFYWEHYADYFIDLYNKGYVEEFTYWINSSFEYPYANDWLSKNKNTLNDFLSWSEQYFTDKID